MDRERINSLYAQAKERPAGERDLFLERACAGDPAAREEVDRLLRQNDETSTYIRPAEPPRTLHRGELIAGRFEITRFLGQGGMGEVYEASDRELGGILALKTLRPARLQDPRFLDRFRREVQLARQVTHPNVCRIFDVGYHRRDSGELAYFTMEFLDGVTLSHMLRQNGPMTPVVAMPLVRQIGDGLQALHEKGIIHRDFKPGNVMIVTPGSGPARAVVADFGLARAMANESGEDPESGPTQAGQIVGTPEYMAPEQLLGAVITPAADIYAFGLVIHEMVTGKRPLPRAAADLPKDWGRTIERCLAKDPAARPASATDVVSGLMGVQPAATLRRRWIALVAVLALLAILLAPRLGIWKGSAVPGSSQHVAVLAFTVLGQDPDLTVFADGLMEGITGRLSQFEGPDTKLLVVPASEVRQQAAKSPADAKSKFGADAVVQGSLQSQGDRVRLLLTLIDTGKMRQTDTVIVEDRRSNALSLEDAAVEKLANALKLRIQPAHARDATTTLAPGAYEYYLQARGYLQRSDKLPNVESAITLFNRVLESDNRSALAFSGLGEAYWTKFTLTRDGRWIAEALKNCQRALVLNPSLPEAQIALGRIHLGSGRYEEAQRAFETVLASDNRNVDAYRGLARAYEGLRQFDQVESTYRKAIALRPEDWNSYRQLALFYYNRGDFDKAIEQYQKVVALTPDNAQGYSNLGAFQIRKGATEDARMSLLRALELDPNRVSALTNLARLYLGQGQYLQAIELFERAVKLNVNDFRMPGGLGIAYKRAGNDAKAVAPLESAIGMLDSELRINPKKAELYSYLAYYKATLGQKDGVDRLLQRARELAPDDVDIMIRSAETEATRGNDRPALDLIQSILAKGYPLEQLKTIAPLRPLLARLGPR